MEVWPQELFLALWQVILACFLNYRPRAWSEMAVFRQFRPYLGVFANLGPLLCNRKSEWPNYLAPPYFLKKWFRPTVSAFFETGSFFSILTIFVHILAFMLKVLGPSSEKVRVKMVICWTFGFSRENEQNHETLETSRKKEKVKRMWKRRKRCENGDQGYLGIIQWKRFEQAAIVSHRPTAAKRKTQIQIFPLVRII